MRRLAALCTLALVAVACAPSTAESDPFNGTWRSIGFGNYLRIGGGVIEIFEHGAGHCVSVAETGTRGISQVVSFDEGDENRILLREAGRVVRYDRVERLPDRCREGTFFDGDPVETFAIVVEAMENHYAGDLDPDWERRSDALAASLTADASPEETFNALTDLLDPLDDPQVRIAVDDDRDGVADIVWRSFEATGTDRLLAAIRAGERLASVAGTRGDGALVAGLVTADVGYLAVTTLEPFTDGIVETGEDIAGIVDGLVESSTPDTKLVIDLRVNPGGVEGLGMVIASRFVQEETTVASRSVRVEGTDDYVEAGTIVIRPTPTGTFPGPFVVLIGPGTSGAAEILALALRTVPGAVFVGERTAGSPSPILARALPTDWALGLPNLRTADAAGIGYDGIGIPPDEFVVTTTADLDAGRDPALDRAVAILSE